MKPPVDILGPSGQMQLGRILGRKPVRKPAEDRSRLEGGVKYSWNKELVLDAYRELHV